VSSAASHLFTARACAALAVANARFWPGVAPAARAHLREWERQAQAIPNGSLRGLALGKLREERFNCEVAATLATLAPRPQRGPAVEAIVALQVLYDYLDAVGEEPVEEPLRNGRWLMRALTDAFEGDGASSRDYYRHHPHSADGGYVRALVDTIHEALERLPGVGAVRAVAKATAVRCAEAQALHHAAANAKIDAVERWARREAVGTELRWQELLAGSCASVLGLHALIAAAADGATTAAQAGELEALYLQIGALTMLDSLLDADADRASGQRSFLDYLGGDAELMATRLRVVARSALQRARAMRDGAHHAMTLAGVVAYYGTGAEDERARSVPDAVLGELGPLGTATRAVMRVWRAAKRRSAAAAEPEHGSERTVAA
jgi:hypothetical protein